MVGKMASREPQRVRHGVCIPEFGEGEPPPPYFPAEWAILFDWLGFQRPAQIEGIDPWDESEELPEGVVRIRKSSDPYADQRLALPAAIARLLLAPIKGTPPVRDRVTEDRGVKTMGDGQSSLHRKVNTFPRLLFNINWADSGPGLSWPDAYYVTYVPEFNCHVVTSTRDSALIYGFTDIAIGWFPEGVEVLEGAGRVIIEFWKGYIEEYSEFARWAYLFDEGLMDTAAVEELADEVWGPSKEQIQRLSVEAFESEDNEADWSNAVYELVALARDGNHRASRALFAGVESTHRKEAAIEALEYIGDSQAPLKEGLPTAINLLCHGSWEVQEAALAAIEGIKPEPNEAVIRPILTIAIDSTADIDVRSRSSHTLAILTGVEAFDSVFPFLPRKRLFRSGRAFVRPSDTLSPTLNGKRNGFQDIAADLVKTIKAEFPISYGQAIDPLATGDPVEPPIERWIRKHRAIQAAEECEREEAKQKAEREARQLEEDVRRITQVEGWRAPWEVDSSRGYGSLTQVEKELLLKWLEQHGVKDPRFGMVAPYGGYGISWIGAKGREHLILGGAYRGEKNVAEVCRTILQRSGLMS